MSNNSFGALGLRANFCEILAKMGFDTPTPIQSESIPEILKGKDVLGLAQTGTGKTAAFGLPLLQRIKEIKKGRAEPKSPRSLILAPTRELALQIHAELEKFSYNSKLYIACVIGGVGQGTQVKKLHSGVDVLVAAPGRLLDLMNQGHIDLRKTEFLVLDECDRLLDMGFIPDVRRILSTMPRTRQSLLFSATMPREIAKFAEETLKDPIKINIAPKQISVEKIQQQIYQIKSGERSSALKQLLRDKNLRRAIVFTRTKHGANRIGRTLNNSGFVAEVIHGNKSQAARQRAILNFKKNGKAWILVATDIAARGIDIQNVSHVINFDLPQEPESYVHRIGRTGRAGAEGIAWSLIEEKEKARVKTIERLIQKKLTITELKVEKDEDNSQIANKSSDDNNQKPTTKSLRNSKNKREHKGNVNSERTRNKKAKKTNLRSKHKTSANKSNREPFQNDEEQSKKTFRKRKSTRKPDPAQKKSNPDGTSKTGSANNQSQGGNRTPRKRPIEPNQRKRT